MDPVPPAPRGKALLIFPQSFYSFADVICKGLVAKGYQVVLANDEYPQSTFGKLIGKLRLFPLLSALTKRVLYRDFIAGKHYELVLIFKGRGLSTSLLERMRPAADRIVAYNFDSFGYNPSPLRWYGSVDKYCTFDSRDAREHKLPLVALFSSLPADDAPGTVRYRLSAILRNHSDRLGFLDRALQLFPDGPRFVYVFEHHLFTFALNVLRNPWLYWKYRKVIHLRSLPYPKYVEALRDSEFTLDYAHPSQTGITIRCFEALAAGTRIITNNRHVLENPLFARDQVVVLDADTDVGQARVGIEAAARAVPVRRNRTINDFLEELLA